MPQLLAHLFGDFILQSDWMAQNKTKRSWPALVHALLYSLCFVPLCWHPDVVHGYFLAKLALNGRLVDCWETFTTIQSRFHLAAWLVIFSTHFLIDRFRLARYVVWAKNWLGPKKFWYRVRAVSGSEDYWTEQVEALQSHAPVDTGNFFMYYCRTPQLWACPDGYPPTTPIWLSTFLLIVADNTLHLCLNYLALRYL